MVDDGRSFEQTGRDPSPARHLPGSVLHDRIGARRLRRCRRVRPARRPPGAATARGTQARRFLRRSPPSTSTALNPAAERAVALLCARPSETGVIIDYDGTLAEIVPNPDEAVPLAEAVGVLERLITEFAVVAIVSGRPVAFLVERLGIGPALNRLGVYGHYGLEHRSIDGSVAREPLVNNYAAAVAGAIRDARAAVPPGAFVEDKGLALTLHWRNAPDVAPAAIELAHEIAERHGLAVLQGKKAIELVLPVANDKGSVVVSLLSSCSAGCVLGDDVGDIPAFAAVDTLVRSKDFTGVRVAVSSPEVPDVLVAQADFVVDGPRGALGFLAELSERASEAERPGV
ncbi:MAG TPA: trehalose-phosphatase [Acidimicrobiales bacterium]|nr:trehalose-phosphatase [Acidimicrobiales bacterium]